MPHQARLARKPHKENSALSANSSRQPLPVLCMDMLPFFHSSVSLTFNKPSLVLFAKGVADQLLVTLYLLLWIKHLMEAVRL